MASTSLYDLADAKVFDYIIIGGGTAGLVLAARLTEDPAVQVVVLEAGEERLDVCTNTDNEHYFTSLT